MLIFMYSSLREIILGIDIIHMNLCNMSGICLETTLMGHINMAMFVVTIVAIS